MINEDVGKYIRKERTKKGFSVRQLALQSGVSASYISRLENNRTKHLIKPSTMKKLANGLRVNEREFFETLNLSEEYNDKIDNQIFKVPLVKNPLLSNNIDDELNLVKYIPFLKIQLTEKSKYVINYHSSNDYNFGINDYFIVLSVIDDFSTLKPDRLVVFLKNGRFYFGHLKVMDKKMFFIDSNFDLFEIKLNRNLKKHLFNVEMFFKKNKH